MSDDELRDLRYAAAFHDIGKVTVPERILRKPGPLTEAEKRAVERHPEAAAEILAEVDFLAGVLPHRPSRPRALGRQRLPRPALR